jgi:hypothetical protein
VTTARISAAQCGAMTSASLLALRPLALGYEWFGLAKLLALLSALGAVATVLLVIRAGWSKPIALDPNDPFAGRPARRLSIAARIIAAVGVVFSLGARLHESQMAPALFWLTALAGLTLSAWLCMHLRASLIRARFFWALALGMLIAVLSALERPDAFAQAPSGPQRLEPGSGVNLVLGVSALLLGEGHPGAELFALVPLYSPSSSAVEPRVPWFRHLAAVVTALLVGVLTAALRSSRAGLKLTALVSALFALGAALMIAVPMIAMPTMFDVLDGAALWMLAGAAALFAPARESQGPEGVHA